VVSIPADIIGGRAISQAKPEYPLAARQQRMSGSVYIRAIIGKDGTISQIGVIDSASPAFSEAALNAVRQWRYRPYLLNGTPVEVSTTITVNFKIGY
jgi:protein TonB